MDLFKVEEFDYKTAYENLVAEIRLKYQAEEDDRKLTRKNLEKFILSLNQEKIMI